MRNQLLCTFFSAQFLLTNSNSSQIQEIQSTHSSNETCIAGYCPFRGCAGDWVKFGVAKRHGAVLGDAVSKMADENTKVQLVESDIPGAELPKHQENDLHKS